MALTATEDKRIQTLEKKLNELQDALNKLATKAQLKQLLLLRQTDIDQVKEDMEHLSETGVSPGLAAHKGDPDAHPDLINKYFPRSVFINLSTGVSDAGKPIILNASGQVDPSMVVGGS